jgi:hypothetical protein
LRSRFSPSDFGIAQRARQPSPSEVSKYGVEDADVFLFVDLAPLLAKNHRAFLALRDKKAIHALAELRADRDRVDADAESDREQRKKMIGLDPAIDVKSIAKWMKLGIRSPPPT